VSEYLLGRLDKGRPARVGEDDFFAGNACVHEFFPQRPVSGVMFNNHQIIYDTS